MGRLGERDLFADATLAGQSGRRESVFALTDCEILRIEKADISKHFVGRARFPTCLSRVCGREMSSSNNTWLISHLISARTNRLHPPSFEKGGGSKPCVPKD
jgi:CRP-like cAMP-binding protein